MKPFLAQAFAIARRVSRDAIWCNGSCNWIGPSIESTDVTDVRHRSFGPDLYAGTSGVALFLASAAEASGERIVRKTAEGAARHAQSHAQDLPPAVRIGMYSGNVGITWALTRVGELLGDGTWVEQGLALLDDIDGQVSAGAIDVMSGYAGAIPVLLDLSRRYGRPAWLERAARWGGELERSAVKSSEGWSWRTIDLPAQLAGRNLTGFSHGTAGIGWAFLELFEATREPRFREAAEEAFRYERTHYSAEHENWPDFRDYLRPPGAPAVPNFGAAWCHGAPGIALSRIRAWRLTGSAEARQEAEAAMRTTRRTLESPNALGGSFSLCHGCGGNADVLLEYDREFQAPELRQVAETVGNQGIEQFEAQRLPWPCGVPGAGETANLMLGLSGIGYFYLRLAKPEIPTALMVG
ncbi:MAG TPA: lanthionine synthetase LanC family protein [Bryobacteraceae bacterium]|nr:lanthionine synthetase LanC family protein [Bryobacteraceae bacterium]